MARSAAVIVRSSVMYNNVASAPMVQPLSSLFQRRPATSARSSSPKTSASMIEAMMMMSCQERSLGSFCNVAVFVWKFA